MKSKTEIQDLRKLSTEDLNQTVSSTEKELLNLRFKHGSNQLQHTAQLGALKKKIARSKTLLVEKALEEVR